MAGTTPNPKLRRRIELAIRVAAPVLDVLLFVGDRVSRVVDRGDPDHHLARIPHDGESAPRGLRVSPPHAPRRSVPRG